MIKDEIIKKYKFYLFGCSHTANMQAEYQHILNDINCYPFCVGGNSNDKIIRDIKSEILNLTNNFTKKTENVYFNIQFTYFNRIDIFSDLEGKYIPFHSTNVMNQPIGTKNREYNRVYNLFYTDWLRYFFNEENRLKELLIECKILKNLMDTFGIKYNWYLWAGINKIEILNSTKNVVEKNYIFESDFEKLGFYKFEDFWYFEDYAKKNKMRMIDNPEKPKDEHLTESSNKKLLQILFDIFYNKIKNFE